MNSSLANQHVVVTGASGSIGSEIARQFARQKANVSVHYHTNQVSAQKVVEQCGDNSNRFAADLTQESQVQLLFTSAIEKFGPIDLFVANAGAWPKEHQTIDQISSNRWEQTLASNLTSTFLCMKYFFAQVQEHQLKQPAAVMISSTAGQIGEAGHSDYAAAKAAIVAGLLPSLKNELGQIAPQGRINVVCPGWTLTPMTQKFADNDHAQKKALQTIAMKKFATPNDIAAAVLFLCSSNSGHITGQSITVSGGMEGRVLYDLDQIEI